MESSSSYEADDRPSSDLPPPAPLTLLDHILYPVLFVPWLTFYALYTLNQGGPARLFSVLQQRLGWYPDCTFPSQETIWIHGVSVGEVMCIPPLIEHIKSHKSDAEFLITTSTLTGQNVASEKFPDATVTYFPIDLPSAVHRAFQAFNPELVLLVEQEVWPAFMREARRRHVPVAVVNGRMTERSASRFALLPHRVRSQMFGTLSCVLGQNNAYADRFRTLGVPPRHLHTTGNIKFDALLSNMPDASEVNALKKTYQISDTDHVLVGGSIHPPEEDALLDAFLALNEQTDRSHRLILAPRHLKNTDRIVKAANERDLSVALHSQTSEDSETPSDVIVVDVMGKLTTVYGLSDLVFVGGSLIEHGGQNVLEPAVLGKPILTGPHTFNFQDEIQMLKQANGLREVQTSNELEKIILRSVNDPETFQKLGRNAKEAISRHRGAAERTVFHLKEHDLLNS